MSPKQTIKIKSRTKINQPSKMNKLATVDASFAVSAKDLAEAIRRVGSSAQDAGVGLDELLALVTSVQQTTARGGAVIGNALKTIFTRIQRPEVIDRLERLGVLARDSSRNLLSAQQILVNLTKRLNKLNGLERAQITELIGGVYQINVLKAILSDLHNASSVYRSILTILK